MKASLQDNSIPIVVFANRKDFFFTKICIASIRFYYPHIPIFLVKDKLNGNFRTERLRKALNVTLLDLGKSYYGWSAAKIHFLLNKTIPQKRYLCLDSDIIFVGNVMEKIAGTKGDFIFNPHYIEEPLTEQALQIYLDPGKVKKYYPDYEYPGYFFNAGQTVVTPGLVTKDLLTHCFDPDVYPYYKNKDTFLLVDQAVLNATMPVLQKRKEISMRPLSYMLLSIQFFADETNNNFEKHKAGETDFMVHYCGEMRTFKLNRMRGGKVLKSLRQQYYNQLSASGKLLDKLQDTITASKRINQLLYIRNRVWIELLRRFNGKK